MASCSHVSSDVDGRLQLGNMREKKRAYSSLDNERDIQYLYTVRKFDAGQCRPTKSKYTVGTSSSASSTPEGQISGRDVMMH